jgi:glutamate 5-kinase
MPDVVLRTVAGERIGTRFPAKVNSMEGRKRWILAETVRTSRIAVDDGAARAVTQQGKSLLPAGVVAVTGDFERGQTVRIFHGDHEIARGLMQYSATDMQRIMGQRSTTIADILGYTYGPEAIHRDDMVLLARTESKEL